MTNKYFKLKNGLRKLNPNCRIHLLVKYITGIEEKLRNSSQNSKWRNRKMKKKIFLRRRYRRYIIEIQNLTILPKYKRPEIKMIEKQK